MKKQAIKFGLNQISNETPLIAVWIFRGYFIVSKAVVGFIAALVAVKELNLSVTTLTVTTLTITLLLDPLVLGFSKLFGIEPQQVEEGSPLLADKQIDEKGNTVSINPVVISQPDSESITPAPKQQSENI